MVDNTITDVLSTNPEVEIAIVNFDPNCPKEDDLLNNKIIDDFIDNDVYKDIKFIHGCSKNDFFDL